MSELLTRAATFTPSTFDKDKRTVQVVFSTGTEVSRYDFDGPYIERLSLEPSAVDLSELIGGPVLNAHNRFDLKDILGVVDAASVNGREGLATLRFSDRHEDIAKDVEA